MRDLGPIIRLQVQPVSLKVGVSPQQRYDPSPLTLVPDLTIEPAGVWGHATDGTRVPDVHHRGHETTKNRGDNSVSICFTSHYAAMRERFGDIIQDGIAGENLLIQAPRVFEESDFASGLMIETAAGPIQLTSIIVAEPCAPFTRFAMQFPDDRRPDITVTESLRFLDHGMRGFYASYEGPPARIATGDRVFFAG